MKKKSYLFLIAISIFYLILAAYPSLLLLRHEVAGLEGFGFIFFSMILFPPSALLSIITHKFVSRKLNFVPIPPIKRKLIAVFIVSFSVTWFFLYMLIVRVIFEYKQFRFEKAVQAIEASIVNEGAVQIDDYLGNPEYPGINPTKYEYQYKILLRNHSRGLGQTKISARLVDESRLCSGHFFHHGPSSNQIIDLRNGDNYLEDSLPIGWFSSCQRTPEKVQIKLILTSGSLLQPQTIIYLPSQIANWERIIKNQTDFIKEYGRVVN